MPRGSDGRVSPQPPRVARRLLRAFLPADLRDPVSSDLDEEFAKHVAPRRSALAARLWYWRQALVSVPSAVRLRRPARASDRALIAWGTVRQWPREAARDFRIGLRVHRRRPAFAASAVLTLAVGMAAVTSVFTIVNAVLLRDLPYSDPDRLVSVGEMDGRREASSGNMSHPDFLDYKAGARSLAGLEGFTGGSRTLVGVGSPDRVPVTEVTVGFLALLGVRPALGRDFVAADAQAGAPLVAILTDRSWRSRFGADPAVVGRGITLSSQPATIIGVLPAEFEFPLRGLAEIWLPVRPSRAQQERRYYHWLDTIGRLRPDVSVDEARAELGVIAANFAATDPEHHPAARVRVIGLQESIVGPVRPLLSLLSGAAAFLFVVACANLAGLLVARGTARAREMQVRLSIGAAPSRLIRQLLVESAAVALPGALVGLLAGHFAVRTFLALVPRAQRASLPHVATLDLDPVVVISAFGLALASALAFSVVPAWQAARRGQALTHGDRSGIVRDMFASKAFVGLQVALAVVLLTGTALMGRSVRALLNESPGFETEHVLTLRVNLTPDRYPDAQRVRAFHAEMLARLAAAPGVAGAATINQLPLTGPGNSGTFVVEGRTDGREVPTFIRTVSPNYFDVMGIPELEGRPFEATDREGAPPVVLVNRTFADEFFGGHPIGERIAFPFFNGRPFWQIVGIVGDEQFDELGERPSPVVYFSHSQTTDNGFGVVVRSSGDPASVVEPVRAAVASLDASLPVFAIQTMPQIIDQSAAVFRRRAALALLSGFACAGLLLTAVGIYGLLSQRVAQRTREIGVRRALGASASRIRWSVLGSGLGPAGVGLALGLATALAAGRAIRSLLYGVGPADPAALAMVIAVVTSVAGAACLIPVARALRIEPTEALRGE